MALLNYLNLGHMKRKKESGVMSSSETSGKKETGARDLLS